MQGCEILSFLSSSAHNFQLENGLSVIFLPITNSDILSVQMWVKTGSIHEGRYLGSGISHFVEHMVFKGTDRRTYAQIFKEVQQQGAKINAYTSFDRTVYTYDGCTRSLDTGLDILGDMLQCSTFPENELVKERDVILREINMTHDDPEDRLSQILFENAFQQHPYHYPIIGVKAIFERLSRKDLLNYWHERYAINNMTLVIAGNLSLKIVKETVSKYLDSYAPRSIPPTFIPQEPFQLAKRDFQEYGDYQLTRGAMAFKIPGIGHKDSAKLQVLANILGEGESSLLYQKLREELHLVYNVEASSWMANGQGLFWIQYTCENGRRSEVETCLQQYLVKWAQASLTEKAIEKAYHQAIVSELDTQKTVSGQAHHVGWATVCLGDKNYMKHYLQQLKNLTPKEVKAVVRKYFKDVSCTCVSLEPRSCCPKDSIVLADLKVGSVVTETEVKGVRVLIQHCDHLPKTHIQAIFSAGAFFEPPQKRGLTQLLATLLTKDTQQHLAAEIALQIEEVGGQLNGFSGNDYLGLSLEVLEDDTPLACRMLEEALTQPAFLSSTFAIEKDAQLAELREMQDDIFYVGFQKLRQQFFQDHPYNTGHLGTEESLLSITLDDVRAFYQKIICKANGIISVVTSLSDAQILKQLEPICGRLSDAQSSIGQQTENFSFKPSMFKEEHLFKEQSMVFQAYPMAGAESQDFYLGEILEELFNGLSSSFVEEVREKRGLAYTVGATRLTGKQQGMFCLFAGTQSSQVKIVEAEMRKGIQRILDKTVTLQEFEICRRCLKVNHQLRLQTIGRKAFYMGYNRLLGLSLQRCLDYEKFIDELTLASFFERCKTYLQPQQVCNLFITPYEE